MQLILNSVQFFTFGLILFGIIGFIRGWHREIVSMGFILATVLFLYVGGANGLASFFLQRVPLGINFLSGGAVGPKTLPPAPSSNQVLAVALIFLLAAIFIGFLVGGSAFKKVTGTPSERFLGIIPGLVEGFAIVEYISHLFASSPQITFGTNTPNPNNLGNSIIVIFLIAIAALIIGLVATRFGKKDEKK